MDILTIIRAAIAESGTVALALFAIWIVKQSYEQRLQDRKDYAEQRLLDRKEYSEKLEATNKVLVEKLGEVSMALGASTEVVRGNTEVMEELQDLLRRRNGPK